MADKLNKKRERGANYTPEEKTLLVDLVLRYKNIIEDKSTGGHILNKKKEAWREITIKYNSNCTTGPRQIEQLKALYDNMKQKSRKDIGERNKKSYINRQTVHTENQNGQTENIITKEELAAALKNVKEDKVQLHKTGGGSWKPKMTDSDSKILAIIQDQVEPLSNPCDSAATYFNDEINIEQIKAPMMETEALEDLETTSGTGIQADYGDMCPLSPSTVFNFTLTHEREMNTAGPSQNNLLTVTTPSKIATPARKTLKNNVQKKVKKSTSAETLKRIYFKKKCENAYLERKKLMAEILNAKQERKLKMMILKKKLDKL